MTKDGVNDASITGAPLLDYIGAASHALTLPLTDRPPVIHRTHARTLTSRHVNDTLPGLYQSPHNQYRPTHRYAAVISSPSSKRCCTEAQSQSVCKAQNKQTSHIVLLLWLLTVTSTRTCLARMVKDLNFKTKDNNLTHKWPDKCKPTDRLATTTSHSTDSTSSLFEDWKRRNRWETKAMGLLSPIRCSLIMG